jgi:hypothetical protein
VLLIGAPPATPPRRETALQETAQRQAAAVRPSAALDSPHGSELQARDITI